MSFVDPASDLYSASIPAIINAISYCIGLLLNCKCHTGIKKIMETRKVVTRPHLSWAMALACLHMLEKFQVGPFPLAWNFRHLHVCFNSAHVKFPRHIYSLPGKFQESFLLLGCYFQTRPDYLILMLKTLYMQVLSLPFINLQFAFRLKGTYWTLVQCCQSAVPLLCNATRESESVGW